MNYNNFLGTEIMSSAILSPPTGMGTKSNLAFTAADSAHAATGGALSFTFEGHALGLMASIPGIS